MVDAWLKVHPDDKAGARQRCLEGFPVHLNDGGIGTLSEIFDAESRTRHAAAWPETAALVTYGSVASQAFSTSATLQPKPALQVGGCGGRLQAARVSF